jgi:uncharacterized protein YraI
MKILIAAAVALTAGLALPASASADHRRTSADYGRTSAGTSMRYGPSREYRRFAYIPRGGRVYVRRCTPRYAWCEVRYRRRTGWINAYYLVDGRYGRRYGSPGFTLSLPLFDFYANIGNFDQDRNRRYRRHRHNDDYYHNLRQRRQSHQRGRRSHRRTDGRHEQRTEDENDKKDDGKKRSGHKRPH